MTQEALKLALEALKMADELCRGHGVDFKEYGLEFDRDIQVKYKDAITAIKEALAHCPDCGQLLGDAGHIHTCSPQRTDQEQQIETLKRCLLQMQEAAKDLVEQAKSLTPPQRTWVGLTKEQLATTDWSADFRAGALWAEAKLREKNSQHKEKNT